MYDNATPMNVAESAIEYISKQTKTKKRTGQYDVIDPFVGRGTIGLYAIRAGLSFLGLDLDPKQCQIASRLLVEE